MYIVESVKKSVRWRIFIISMKDLCGETDVHIAWHVFPNVHRKQSNMEEKQWEKKDTYVRNKGSSLTCGGTVEVFCKSGKEIN